MYQPAHFAETRPEALAALIARHPLGTVIVNGPDGPAADHIPLKLLTDVDGRQRLIGHVARANPLWQLADGQAVLVVFAGEQAYVSPNWYATKAEGGRVVPTWNYAAVHVQGRLQAVQDPQGLMPILTALTDAHEQPQPHPWQVSDAPADFTARLLGAIVGIEIEVAAMAGKWKMSQNQPEANRLGVVQGLRAAGDADTARTVRSRLQPMDLQPVLEGPTLRLRPMAPGDFDALYAVARDPELWAQHPEPERHQAPVFQRFFDSGLASGGALVVTDRASGQVLGASRFYQWNEARQDVAVGYTFLARSHWGGATNAELKRLMLGHAFQWCHTVHFHVGEHNLRSRRALEKIGAQVCAQPRAGDPMVTTGTVVYRVAARRWVPC